MRTSRFLLLSIILFVICFWFSGGSNIISQDTKELSTKLQDQIHPSVKDSSISDINTNSPQNITTLDRISRIVFLRDAVAKTVSGKKYVTIDKIGVPLQQAIIAVEDNRFYSHWGFDIESILRASLVNLQYGKIEEGASTITQQLVKNLFLSHEQSFGRKAEELILAVDMENRYSKEKILELYLNTIYFGSNFYGIQEASQGYFGKDPEDLTLAEASMLAGLPNAPSLYSPYVDFPMAKKRQSVVLDTMVRAGFVAPTIAEKTKQTPLYLKH